MTAHSARKTSPTSQKASSRCSDSGTRTTRLGRRRGRSAIKSCRWRSSRSASACGTTSAHFTRKTSRRCKAPSKAWRRRCRGSRRRSPPRGIRPRGWRSASRRRQAERRHCSTDSTTRGRSPSSTRTLNSRRGSQPSQRKWKPTPLMSGYGRRSGSKRLRRSRVWKPRQSGWARSCSLSGRRCSRCRGSRTPTSSLRSSESRLRSWMRRSPGSRRRWCSWSRSWQRRGPGRPPTGISTRYSAPSLPCRQS
mmetsp:Transcript_22563/g.62627  ORF Transcript_22563/g.62627 Transcript_22563/m.62627 type:complete len:250 (-) Transcript_22563:13-762(-)